VRPARSCFVNASCLHSAGWHSRARRHGEVAEWLKAPHSKCGVRVTVPGVRIPPSPPALAPLHLECCDAPWFPEWELGAAPWQLKRSRAQLLTRPLGGFHAELPGAQPARPPPAWWQAFNRWCIQGSGKPRARGNCRHDMISFDDTPPRRGQASHKAWQRSRRGARKIQRRHETRRAKPGSSRVIRQQGRK
jgi:hypothetical protein